ncbi:Endothiapepsin [Cladobotryum mycophilum]|uniref:Endothiapepsin n=1 Tax=Cladobotryum mycophilum TaxID=491253 RepID=A0ABR0SDF2_9HYPO
MKVETVALLLAGLANSTSASVVGTRDNSSSSAHTGGNKRFSLSQIPNGRFQGHNIPASLILAHAKYGNGLPPHLKEAIRINPDLNRKYGPLLREGGASTGSAPAMPAPMSDSEYVIPVKIGTPPQEIPLNLDTGSSDLWSISTDTYPPQVKGQKLYNPAKSSTSKRIPSQGWQVKYGDGAGASGIVYRDRVQIGDTSFDRQAVQSAVQISLDIANDDFSSGIIGMANSKANTINPDKEQTYMDNIKDQLEMPVFTANLQKGRPGNYNFGYINEKEFHGPIQYAAANPNSSYWEITVSGYQIGKEGKYKPNGWNGIVDTGTTLLLVPQNIVDDFYGQIKNSGWDHTVGAIVLPCDTDIPDFIFGLGPYRGVIPGRYINYANVNSTHCYGGIQTSDDIPFSVLGDILLKAQFVVFDYGQQAVGFANKDTDS